jgi:hypothetical protein
MRRGKVRPEAECIEAGDPFITRIAKLDDVIADYVYRWTWLDLTAQEGWMRAVEVQRALDTYEIEWLTRWWMLPTWPEGHA